MHKLDDRTDVRDGRHPLEVPAGWEIAPCDADSARVCGAHAWQSDCLVFATNGTPHGTAMCNHPQYIGKCGACGCLRCGGGFEIFASREKTGKPCGNRSGGYLKWDGARVCTLADNVDVLLRKRV